MAKVMGADNVRKMFAKKVGEISGPMTEETVTRVLIIGGMYASALTPIDTSTLINSQYRKVEKTLVGYAGEIGYGARYAEAVHDSPGTLKGQPRADFGRTSNRSSVGPQRPTSFGGGTGVGNYWDPNAEPGFLTKGFERDGKSEIEAVIKRSYRI